MKYLITPVFFIVLLFRYLSTLPNFDEGQVLKVRGQITSEPSLSFNSARFNLAGLKVVLTKGPEIHYGDFISLEGVYQDGEVVTTKIIAQNAPSNLLIKTRQHLISFYKTALKEPHSSLVAGITLGAKSSLPYNFLSNLRKTGTSHIVVASGTNVMFVAGFLMSITLKKFSRRKALLFTITFIWIYTVITGFEAPIIRASVMASITFLGIFLGRITNTFKILILTGYLMLLVSPSWIKDIGFLLSFATTLSLVLFQTKIIKLLNFLPSIIKEDFATSLTAQIGAAPIIFFFFGNLNLLSPFINILILWTVPIIMIIGGLSGILSFISFPLAKFLLILLYPLTSWFIAVVNFFGRL